MNEYDLDRDFGRLLDRLPSIYRRLSPQRRRRFLDELRLVMEDYEAEEPVEDARSISRTINCPCCGDPLTVTLTCNT